MASRVNRLNEIVSQLTLRHQQEYLLFNLVSKYARPEDQDNRSRTATGGDGSLSDRADEGVAVLRQPARQ
jgi:hypothetical protein